ncbi:hypothetical protein ACELLULO517_22640 [Acidisoma cellulosilytica]|uniref:Outer membrane lipoprotein carrier protein LolA n=1 Tax=Acidisoma cellulosilyticum TaxID=2802395 RepID=A0A964E5Z7_9PROT|nr:hypothetical protein [Acidisoma cellulosilyticum]MCB8883064.1 hypothetical protein [Acidisoma cellulosilyticum]
MRAAVAILLSLALAKPAFADITAKYAPPNSAATVRLEIASNGDVRGDLYGKTAKQSSAFIIRNGQYYFLDTGPSGIGVIRAEDMNRLLLEKIDPATRAQEQQADNVLSFPEKGLATVNGRTGAAFDMQVGSGDLLSPESWAVMSSDPTLAPIGAAMVRVFKLSMTNVAMVNGQQTFRNMLSVLKRGSPLSAVLFFGSAQLQSVDFKAIPATEFALPAKPDTFEAARNRLSSEGKL